MSVRQIQTVQAINMADERAGTSHLDPPSPITPVTPTYSARGARGDDDDQNAVNAAAAGEDSASSVDHVVEKDTTPKEKKRVKVKKHFRRFWWAYLIGLIVLLAILLPILFEVIIPKIVQNILNGQKLPVNSGEIRSLSPTQLNISLNTELDTPLPAKIDALPLELYNKDTEEYTPFVKITLPEISVDGKTEAAVRDQTVTIMDDKELIKWFNGVFDLEEVEVAVRGSPKVHLGELDYSPSLDKTLKVPALNYLKGFGIKDLNLVLPPDENGFNIKGTLNLPNSGALTLALGNLTFNMLSGDLVLGYASIYDVEMKPGMNNPYFEGELYLKELIPNLATILDDQKHALANGNVEFNATGNSSVVNGQRIKYVEDVLNTKRITFQLPVMTLLSDVLNGLLGDRGNLLDMFGEVFGNETLVDNIVEHWNLTEPTGNGTSVTSEMKRAVKKASLWGSFSKNMLRLGDRTKEHHKSEL